MEKKMLSSETEFSAVAENLLLERKETATKNKPQRKTGYMSLERIQTTILLVTGMILFGLGAAGLMVKLLSLHAFFGCLSYSTVGMIIILKTSSTARNYLRRLVLDTLPPNVISLMFEKSLLEVFTDTNESSPMYIMKAFTLLGLCSFLDRSEIHALAETLPSECNFLHRPGLVNLMPLSLRDVISPEREDHDEQQHHNGEEDDEQQSIPVRSGVLIRPIDLNDPSSGDASSLRDNGTPPFFSLPSSLLIEDEDVSRRATAVEVPDTPPRSFPTESTPSRPTQIPFEQLLQQIVHRRVNESKEWIQQQISTVATSQAYYLASGGDLSDNTVASVCVMGVVGTAMVLSTSSSSWLRRKYPTVDEILKTLPMNISYNNAALSYTSTVALVSGGMWIVRQINRTDCTEIMGPVHDSNNQSTLITLSKRFWYVMKSFFNPIRWREMGLELIYDNPKVIYLVVAAWSLTALLAWKLRSKITSMRWIFQSIFAKLIQNASEWRQNGIFGHSLS